MPNKKKLCKTTSVKHQKWHSKASHPQSKEETTLLYTPVLHLLSPFPCRAGASCKHIPSSRVSEILRVPGCSCRPHGSRQDLSNSYSCFSLAGFSRKWPWNQLHHRGLRNAQQGCVTTELLQETKHLSSQTPCTPRGRSFQPAGSWVLSMCFQRQLLLGGTSKSTKVVCVWN